MKKNKPLLHLQKRFVLLKKLFFDATYAKNAVDSGEGINDTIGNIGIAINHCICIVALGFIDQVFDVDTNSGNDGRKSGKHIGNVAMADADA